MPSRFGDAGCQRVRFLIGERASQVEQAEFRLLALHLLGCLSSHFFESARLRGGLPCLTSRSRRHKSSVAKFQSSAAPKNGCNTGVDGHRPLRCSCFNPQPPRRTAVTRTLPASYFGHHWFQSSAAPKNGCNCLEKFSSMRACAGFQSSAAPKNGCNPSACKNTRSISFQSSAAPKNGCNRRAAAGAGAAAKVSILSRPEERLQPASCCWRWCCC